MIVCGIEYHFRYFRNTAASCWVFDPPANKKAIVGAAAELIEKTGLDNITLQAVAKRVGIKTPSLYNHIDGLAALNEKLALFALHALEEVLRDAAIGTVEVMDAGHGVGGLLYQVLKPFGLSDEEALHAIRGFRSALHGFVSLEGAGFFKAEPDVDESFRRLVAGMISMFRSN